MNSLFSDYPGLSGPPQGITGDRNDNDHNLPGCFTGSRGETVALTDEKLPAPASLKPAKRVRRSAEEARRLILDAAEKRVEKQGPEGIRLQDIARDVGVSHPAILHHFESRNGLVRALIHRASEKLRNSLRNSAELIADPENRNRAPDLIHNTFETLSDGGAARLFYWLLLTKPEHPSSSDPSLDILEEASALVHKHRINYYVDEKGLPMPEYEDTVFISMLTAYAAIGEAVISKGLYKATGLSRENTATRFRDWLAALLDEHMRQSNHARDKDRTTGQQKPEDRSPAPETGAKPKQ